MLCSIKNHKTIELKTPFYQKVTITNPINLFRKSDKKFGRLPNNTRHKQTQKTTQLYNTNPPKQQQQQQSVLQYQTQFTFSYKPNQTEMGSGCSQHKDIDDPDSEGYNSYRKIKKVVSRKRHSLAVSNNNDGLDASVRFVKLKNSAGTRPDHDPMIDNKDAPRDSFTEKNPFEVRASNVHQIPSDNTKPPLFGEHSTIDEITLGRKLGSGTYGTVYSAHFTGMNGFLSEKTIAAKVLKVPHEQSECERLLIDFENEIKILARVQHPRILLYLGSINQPGDYIIMTELLAGNVCQVLKKTKDTGHSISWDIATQIMLDVSEAMEFLHSRNPPIIHRDLKSENVLLTQGKKMLEKRSGV